MGNVPEEQRGAPLSKDSGGQVSRGKRRGAVILEKGAGGGKGLWKDTVRRAG